ncbi:hypothetical protein BV898_00189 [Hypsibius exemplaris]|uniref:Uncharacterized protein n=1 Tax=Hypsibius exemplaris TaxID=2072580 RepID=A0A1W0XEZ6_HYPEX|nr:hypothetical protein BV898_00189 [Hypsibius exemplaris]
MKQSAVIAVFFGLFALTVVIVDGKGSRKLAATTVAPSKNVIASSSTAPTATTSSSVAGADKTTASTIVPPSPSEIRGKASGKNVAKPPKSFGSRQHHHYHKHGNRTARQINPLALSGGGFGGGFPSFGTGSGTAISAANAAMGQSSSTGNTFTDRFGNSRSSASGFSSGYAPSSTSIATSNSQGSGLGRRRKRQSFGGFGMPLTYGTGSGSAITAANAAMGQSLSNGNSYTDPFGNSQSVASGFSSGYAPSSTSIATSNSQGTSGGLFGRKKRQSFGNGFGFPSFGTGSGMAISAANAAMGQSTSNGNTFTDPFGNSHSSASGFSSGYAPSATSIATSNSQGTSPFGSMGFGRRKRQTHSSDLRQKRQAFGYGSGFLPLSGTGSGSAIGTANAAMGQSLSSGNTFTDRFGSSQSIANGMSSGYAPSSTSIATSNSQGSIGRRRRDTEAFADALNDNFHKTLTSDAIKTQTDVKVMDSVDWKAGHLPAEVAVGPLGVLENGTVVVSDHGMTADEHLDMDGSPPASQTYTQGLVLPMHFFQTPIARNDNPQALSYSLNQVGQPSVWNPATDPAFVSSIEAANRAAQHSHGQGNAAGVVAVSGNKPDGSIYASKPVNFNVPLVYPLSGPTSLIQSTPAAVTSATLPSVGGGVTEVQRDIRAMVTTSVPVDSTTISTTAATVTTGTDSTTATEVSTLQTTLTTPTPSIDGVTIIA